MIKDLKLYTTVIADIFMLGVASLSEIDMEMRILVGFIGVIVAILTCRKLIIQTRRLHLENKILKSDLRIQEERERLFFEQRHEVKS